jgi:hypothetical protein
LSDFPLQEFLDHTWKHRVVERFSNFLKPNVQSVIDLLELNSRQLAKHLPALNAVIVTRLELHYVRVGSLFKLLISIKSLLSILVEGLKIGDVRLLVHEVWEVII